MYEVCPELKKKVRIPASGTRQLTYRGERMNERHLRTDHLLTDVKGRFICGMRLFWQPK